MTIEQALKEAAIEAEYKNWNDVENNPSYGGSSIRAVAVKAMIIYADAKSKQSFDAAVKMLLENISISFNVNKYRSNKQSDIDVFQAISETIKSFEPKPTFEEYKNNNNGNT